MSANNRNKATVWHYTYDDIVDIFESGVLLPPWKTPHFNDLDASLLVFGGSIRKGKGFRADSRMLLFSQREDWEPSSYRGLVKAGTVIDLHRLEDYEVYGIRVYRVGVGRDLLHPWMRLKRLCRMPPDMAKALETTARELGSNPFDWWGTTRPIPQDKWRSVEVYNPATKAWETVTEVTKIEPQGVPPEAESKVVFDQEGNLVAGQAILEEIVASGKPKFVLVSSAADSEAKPSISNQKGGQDADA
jgi:hypothetical protein